MYRTNVSATNCTSGRKCSNRLDVIVCDVLCDVLCDGCRCYYSVIIRMVHKYHIVHIHIVHMVSRASSLLLLFLSFVLSVLFSYCFHHSFYYHVVRDDYIGWLAY